MKIRPPRPVKAVWSLIQAARGDGPTLYRFVYETDSGNEGVFIWFEGFDEEPAVIYNTHEVFLPAQEYVVVEDYRTTINGETVPLRELVEKSDAETTGKEMIRAPSQFENSQIPPIDNKHMIES